MRLRQEFRTRHRTMVARRAAVVSAWALAAAAILLGAISSWNWHQARLLEAAKQKIAAQNALVADNDQSQLLGSFSAGLGSADDSGDFTPLPGTTLEETEDTSILHVRMQRGS